MSQNNIDVQFITHCFLARRRLFRGRRPNPPGFGQNGGK